MKYFGKFLFIFMIPFSCFNMNSAVFGQSQAILTLDEHFALLTVLLVICAVTIISFIVIFRNRVSILKIQNEKIQSEERYHSLVKQSSEGIFLFDPNTLQILEANNQFLIMLGYSEAELLQLRTVDIVLDESESLLNNIGKIITNREIVYSERKYKRKDGSHLEVACKGSLIEFSGTSVVLVNVSDITERKIREEQLKESEERFRLLVKSIPNPVVISEFKDGTILFENEYASQLFGVKQGELIGRKTTEFYINSDERSKLLNALGDNEHITGIEVLGRNVQGQTINLLVSATAIKYMGASSILTTFTDVTSLIKVETELIENEEKFRSIFENMVEGFYQVDEDGKFILANNALIKMLGYESEDEFLNLNLESDVFVHFSERAQVRQLAFQLKTRTYTEVVWKKKNGSHLTVSVSERIVWGKINNFKYFEAIVIDISELKKTELARKDLEEQLIQTQKLESLGTLAGGIAHDFNNVLSMILLASESLKRYSENNQEIIKYSDIISSSAERGATISKQLLLFARSEKVNLQPISLTHIVNEVISLIHHSFPKSIEIKTEFSAANGIIMGNGGHLQQVIMNLAINGRDAMISESSSHPAGKLTFKIATVLKENISNKFVDLKSELYVVLSISDTGTGMDEETIQRIFEPFFTTKSRGKGTGLGLSIVHGIIQSHNGFIDVDSEIGKGTNISIYFPAVLQQDELPAEKATQFKGNGNETILIVDDEGLLRETMMNALTNSGYFVLDAKHGIQAIEIYKENAGNIDLVITDLGMPYMDGEELFFELKNLNPDIHVIVSTGYLEKGSKEEMIAKGIKDVVLKPYRIKELLEAVRNVLDRKAKNK